MSEEDVEIIDFSEKENETVEESETKGKGSSRGIDELKEEAIRMLKEGKPVEEIVEKTGLPSQVIYGLKGSLAKKGEIPKESMEEEGGAPESSGEEPIFKSPKEQLEEWFIKELEKRLGNIMGNKTTKLVIETLKDNPDIIWDPQMLRYHIVQINPKVNKYMLDWTLNTLYRKLNELKAAYEQEPTFSMPIEPPQLPEFSSQFEITPPRHSTKGINAYPRQYPTNPYYQPMPMYYQGYNVVSMIKGIIDKVLDRLEKQQQEPLVEVPFGDKTIKVPASQAGLYYTLSTIMEEIKKISEDKNKEPMVKIPLGDKVVEMPASQAAYYVIAQSEKEKRRLLEETTKRIIDRYSPDRVIRAIEESSLQRSPSPTLDLINKARQDINKHLEKVLSLIEIGLKQQIKPQVPQMPKYSPEEREKKIEEVSEAIKEAQEQAQLENEIKELVPYVVGGEEEEEKEES